MKKYILSLIFVVAFAQEHKAQYYTPDNQPKKEKSGIFEDWKQKIFFGGNLGLNFGRYYSHAEISPLIGYKIHEKLSIGATLSYIYLKSRLAYSLQYANNSTTILYYDYNSHIVGFSPFSRIFISDFFFLHGEYNLYNGDVIHTKNTPDYIWERREFIGIPLAGGGINYKFGDKVGVLIMALYNFSYYQNLGKFPLYQSPIVYRVGFYF